MADWRRYTGTQRLQIGLTALAVGGLALSIGFTDSGTLRVVIVAGVSAAWLAGLVGLGFRERRRWKTLVDESAFEQRGGPRSTDIERIVSGRSVTVTTDVPAVRAQAHATVQTPVEDVDAEFTVTISYVEAERTGDGVVTGNEALDEQFVFEGTEQNIAHILSTDVQAALMDIETPGTCTITGDTVSYEVPFTALSPAELNTIGDTVLTIARQVEAVAAET